MLYLDTSALLKCYFKEEVGSDLVIARATAPSQELFTSVLTFAEMHSVMARKHREKQISLKELSRLRETFERDWAILVTAVELNLQTMAALPALVEQFRLRDGDAVQLSTAVWLKNNIEAVGDTRTSKVVEFGVADRDLADIARMCGLVVFNPEGEN
jgi:predicted nucleic acid-binding protein